VGREQELKALDAAWSGAGKQNVVTIVAWGGVGKTSLVARWAANAMAKENHGGIERYFDWSFYSQGSRTEGDATGADKAASADIFVKEALEFFGDPDLAGSSKGAWQKGERLASLVAEHRTLLILDGLEPLQDAKSGELRDEALRALLRGLAADSRGLCIVTTRQQLPELNNWHATTSPEWQLAKLSKEAGAVLLKNLGVNGSSTERIQLAADVKGHALTLTLLGRYIAAAHGGDVRKRDLVSLTEADYEEASGHAFHAMAAYERWLIKDGRHSELAILRLLGLFDRPATPGCLVALRTAVLPGITDTLGQLTDAQWNLAVKRLVQLGLVEEQPWEPLRTAGYSEKLARKAREPGREDRAFSLGAPKPFSLNAQFSINSIEAHPLIREYFGRRLRETETDAWRAAHSCLFDHLRSSVSYWPEGLEGLQPLYQAVAHGCLAGRYETCVGVYRDRILRGTLGPRSFYSTFKLGALSADLAAVGCFFVEPWTRLAPELEEADQAWFLNEAAFRLSALGRLAEGREPMQVGMDRRIEQGDWKNAAASASNLSGLDLTLGDVESAVREGRQSVTFADRSGNAFLRMINRVRLADALHHAGREEEAQSRFEESEAMQRKWTPNRPLLCSLQGFLFCNLIIADAARAAWQVVLKYADTSALSASDLMPMAFDASSIGPESIGPALNFESLRTVEERSQKMFEWRTQDQWLLNTALDHLTLGQAKLYRAILELSAVDIRNSELALHIDAAVHGLGQAGTSDYRPRGLLTRAWLRALQNRVMDARADLDEAQQIAERGPMPLHLADIHLYRARLFFRDDLDAAREDLRQARILIEKHGYLCRMPELEDAEKVILAVK